MFKMLKDLRFSSSSSAHYSPGSVKFAEWINKESVTTTFPSMLDYGSSMKNMTTQDEFFEE
jgi:hypothetical protein